MASLRLQGEPEGVRCIIWFVRKLPGLKHFRAAQRKGRAGVTPRS